MPQRRINTPIPAFNAGWGDWTPIVLAWYDVAGVVCAPPVNPVTSSGRYRKFQGMVEIELFVGWLIDVTDIQTYFETPLPLIGLPVVVSAPNANTSVGIVDITPAVQPPISYGASGCSGYIDCIRNVLNSGSISGATLQRYVHLTGYYPVVIP